MILYVEFADKIPRDKDPLGSLSLSPIESLALEGKPRNFILVVPEGMHVEGNFKVLESDFTLEDIIKIALENCPEKVISREEVFKNTLEEYFACSPLGILWDLFGGAEER